MTPLPQLIHYMHLYYFPRGTPNLASVSKRHTWMGCGTWGDLQ